MSLKLVHGECLSTRHGYTAEPATGVLKQKKIVRSNSVLPVEGPATGSADAVSKGRTILKTGTEYPRKRVGGRENHDLPKRQRRMIEQGSS